MQEDLNKVFSEIMEDGTFENILRERVEKGIRDAIDTSFSWGKVRDVIREKIESTMVPAIEEYDMSAYTIKLDTILTEIINNTTVVDNQKILSRFKCLMSEPEKDTITVEELFKAYKDYISKELDTSGREVVYDTGDPQYEPVEATISLIHEEDIKWSNFDFADLILQVDDEKCGCNNYHMKLSRWKGHDTKGFPIHYRGDTQINSLRGLSDFEVFLLQLSRANVYLVIDNENCWSSVTSDYENSDTVYSINEPEVTFV